LILSLLVLVDFMIFRKGKSSVNMFACLCLCV
jgi:hypothetical protein